MVNRKSVNRGQKNIIIFTEYQQGASSILDVTDGL